jgi:hypothetical protein
MLLLCAKPPPLPRATVWRLPEDGAPLRTMTPALITIIVNPIRQHIVATGTKHKRRVLFGRGGMLTGEAGSSTVIVT